MSKKILKRSLVMGALMAFVITGNALAEEYNGKLPESTEQESTKIFTTNSSFINASIGLSSVGGGYNTNKYYNIYPSSGCSDNRVITRGDFFYNVSDRHFFLQGGRFADNTSLGVVVNNILKIEHNIRVYRAIEMYGGAIHASNGQVGNLEKTMLL